MKSFKTLQLALCFLVLNTSIAFGQGDSKAFSIYASEINKADEITTEATTEIQEHILKHVTYPELMEEFKIEGRSEITVSIDAQGNIISKTVTKSIGKAFDVEIMKSLKDMRKVSPVYINGTAQRYAIVVPVQFSM